MMLSIRDRRVQLIVAFVVLLAAGLVVTTANSQRGRSGPGNRFARMEQQALAEPFVGVSADGAIEPGLFSVQSSGVSTQPVVDAAAAFLATLSPSQRERVQFPVDAPEWRRWANQHSYPRQGISFAELDDAQREAGFGLMRAGLSAEGFRQSRDIMRLNHTLGELTSNFEEFGEWLYYFTVMGTPSSDQPWGWQLDGHHLIVNYFVLGDQVVMTPTFMGSEPVIAESGKYEGVEVMRAEMQRGLDLMQALEAGQRAEALLSSGKDGNDAMAQAFRDNLVLDYAGIRADGLTDPQRDLLLKVVESFVGHMADGHARVRMDEVREHLDRTYFAWIGGFDDDAVFYYRIHSPVVLIEFDHQRPVFMRWLPREPQRQHVHAVIRTPNGNDYGKDLLRLHYERSHGTGSAPPSAD